MGQLHCNQGSFIDKVEKEQRKKLKSIKILLVAAVVLVGIIVVFSIISRIIKADKKVETRSYTVENIPEYEGEIYCALNNNIPLFDTEMNDSFEKYGELDEYGRCTLAFANVCEETMPTEERGEIGYIQPSGWNQEKYPGIVDSSPAYLYNRCHLIGYQLTGENDNEKNLITGTRYFNVEGMLPFENRVREYIDNTGNHVLYRVTPIYEGKNLVVSGVVMEAWSVEDNGKGVCFNVFVYNVQPGIRIDYADGSSCVE